MKNKRSSVFSAFTMNVLLVILVIAGVAIIPYLPVKLNPTRSLPSITVNYQWPLASARVIEMEVTSRLEGLFNTLRGVRHITSHSGHGQGNVTLELDPAINLDQARFEVANRIREIASQLPEQVSRPQIHLNRPEEGTEIQLMSYTINANTSTHFIHRYAGQHVRVPLSLVDGVQDVRVYGATPYAYEITYDQELLHRLNITPGEIRQAVQQYFNTLELGWGYLEESAAGDPARPSYLVLRSFRGDSIPWSEIPVVSREQRIIRLTDLADIRFREQEPTGYYRINGLNTVNISIYAEKGANHIRLAHQVEKTIDQIRSRLPVEYSLIKTYDSTRFLKKELKKIGYRTLFSVIILLLFVLVISRQFRYLLVVAISLFANITVACIFYYLFRLEIHLYTLAGITVSLGILIDNTIIMADHLRHHHNRRAFIAILAATLTTVGALTAIFFLDESLRVNLIDFAKVVIINLLVSLCIALFFLPALVEKISLVKKRSRFFYRRMRRAARFSGFYQRAIRFMVRFRYIWLILAVLGFGLPVYKLPDKIEGERWYIKLYNHTIGSDTYVLNMKPWINKVLGGSLRLFTQHVYEKNYYSEPRRTTLYVVAYMPHGATLTQMNNMFRGLENFMARFEEVEQYQSHIYSSSRARMIIYFRKEFENGYFPYQLKSMLEQKAVITGGADFQVYGVGRGFSNIMHEGYTNSSIILHGYNYDELMGYAGILKGKILEQPRVKEVLIRSQNTWYIQRAETIRFMDINSGKFSGGPPNLRLLYQSLSELSAAPVRVTSVPRGEDIIPVILRSEASRTDDRWLLYHSPVIADTAGFTKLEHVSTVRTEKGEDLIAKEDQQYIVTLAYDFIGPGKLARLVEDEMVDKANLMLPLGYQASHREWGYWGWKNESKPYWIILLIIGIIYVVCAILLESTVQPLVVISLIPLSFIGVFLTFYIFDFNFDQGGYASFLLLSGLVVNSSLYIINELNNLQKTRPAVPRVHLYITAFQRKIVPVFLTVVSTVLGLVPFLLGGQDEIFWFALAVGTIGGLLLSIPGLFLYLPLFLRGMGGESKKLSS